MSAHRQLHGTEAALPHVRNDLILVVDNKGGAI